MQHGIPAHLVFLLQVRHGWQRPGPPFARSDTPPQDYLKLTVCRDWQTGINDVLSAHKINLEYARPALTSTYIYVGLL